MMGTGIIEEKITMTQRDSTPGGRVASPRLMDETYVMCEDERIKGVIVDVHCRQLSPCWPNPLYSSYYRKLLDAYGIGPVFVWEDKRVVGFLPISVIDCGIPELPHCVHYAGGLAYGAKRHIDLSMVEKAHALPFDQLSRKEIRIGCMTLHPAHRGRNLGTSMIEYLCDWARDRRWEKVRARAMLDGEREAFYPTSSWWKALGFKSAGEVRRFGPSGNPIDRSQAIDLVFEL
jgi:GNAT superfamily N-acetyltransferase